MEDYSRNEDEKQRRNIMLFGQYVYISICVMYVFSYSNYFALKLYSWKCLYDRYLPLEEALSLELESYPQ